MGFMQWPAYGGHLEWSWCRRSKANMFELFELFWKCQDMPGEYNISVCTSNYCIYIWCIYCKYIYILISSAFILITSLTSLDWFLDGLAPKVTLASRNDWGWKPSGNTPKCTVVSISQWWVRCELDVFLSTEDNSMLRFVTLFALHLWQISEFPTNKASIAIAGTNCLEYLVANEVRPLPFWRATLDAQNPTSTSSDDSNILCLNQKGTYFKIFPCCFSLFLQMHLRT